MESKPSDLVLGILIMSKSKGLDSKKQYYGIQTFRFGTRYFGHVQI